MPSSRSLQIVAPWCPCALVRSDKTITADSIVLSWYSAEQGWCPYQYGVTISWNQVQCSAILVTDAADVGGFHYDSANKAGEPPQRLLLLIVFKFLKLTQYLVSQTCSRYWMHQPLWICKAYILVIQHCPSLFKLMQCLCSYWMQQPVHMQSIHISP